jgi:hypothetical protein
MSEYLDAIDARLLPVFAMLSVTNGILGLVVVVVLAEAGAPVSDLAFFKDVMLAFALLPLAYAVVLDPLEARLWAWLGGDES